MRVLLINPTQRHALESEVGALPEDGTGRYPPLGLLYLQAAVEAGGEHRADVLDANLPGPWERRLHQTLRGDPPGLVGVSALTPNLVSVVRTIQAVRRAAPDVPLVIGGPHVEAFPRQSAALDGVDYALAGEAELTLPRLVEALAAGERHPRIPGLFTAGSAPREAAPLCDDLDTLPAPDRARLDPLAYRGAAGEDRSFATILTSRGCPHRCTFCSTPRGVPRLRSVASIVEEMERCAALGVEHIYFLDDTFPTGGRRLAELCRAIADRPALPSWSCRTAAVGLTAEGLRQMKAAGCARVQIGVETGTDEGLRELGKAADVARIRETFAAAAAAGVPTMAYFMLGLPHERRPEDVRRMMRFAREIRPVYALFNVLTLYPGTELLARAVDRGLTEADVWARFAADPRPDFLPPVWDEFFSREELARLQAEAYRRFYARPSTVWRLVRHGGSLRHKAVAGAQMLAPRLARAAERLR